MPTLIYLDTQAFEAVSFNFNTTTFSSLLEQVALGRANVLVTDITVREVRARIAKNVGEQLRPIERFKKEARVLRSSTLPEVAAALAVDAKSVIDDICSQFERFLEHSKTEIIDSSQVPAGPVLVKYFQGAAPFANQETKKHEFPDAFAVEAIIHYARARHEPVHVVSGDDLFRAACEGAEFLKPVEALSSVLDEIVAEHAVADFLRAEVTRLEDDIAARVKSDFEDIIYHVDDQWGDATMTVKSMELTGEPEVIERGAGSATVEVRYDVVFDAHLSYDDSDTGVYDSESKSQMFMEHVSETLEQEEEFVVEVKISFSEDLVQGEAIINDINLVQPNESYSVSSSKMDGYPWK